MSISKSQALKQAKGYKERYSSSGKKKYNFNKAIKAYKKTGYFKVKVNGSGHDAGNKWAESKQIDPSSRVQKYGKNSPSFDEGVYAYKQSAKQKALEANKA